MPGKRSKRSKVDRFHCPHCEARLWRLGSQKYHLFYTHLSEMTAEGGIPRKQAALLISQKSEYVDNCAWLEEFFCGEHGKMWMLVRQSSEGVLTAIVPSEHDWKRTTGTLFPNRPNPSVSEFTYRMSRGAG
ncbi:hypothetical protein [Gloeobacter violaceus]|uniref:Gll0452 protein n=1 Tax=Gloeobacter violaceus (strain ATCC 29082 / PCC 7421) TaxID=251221 RepID=Q7NNF9_GLOVI|nr:hypothetical protein [Gloeobacter violaceus]BAC88393.1 gll0452 [Gloeobacter violaceus PCC 7421]